MTAKRLYQEGKLAEAIQALGNELRDNPLDVQRRTFLFELLCFAGEYDRAEKHLNFLAKDGGNAELGAVLYFSAIHAARMRDKMFADREFPAGSDAPTELAGEVNGRPFTYFADADHRISGRLEMFAAGSYMLLPFEHIEEIEIEKPVRLRDLLWIPALVRTGPKFKGKELGQVLLPALTPLASQSGKADVRLGRVTEYEETPEGILPAGQKEFLVDDDVIGLLEIRHLKFTQTAETESSGE